MRLLTVTWLSSRTPSKIYLQGSIPYVGTRVFLDSMTNLSYPLAPMSD